MSFGIWIDSNNNYNTAQKIELNGLQVDKYTPEIIAILHSVQQLPINTNIHIKTSSKFIISAFITKSKKWEDQNYIDIPNGEIIRATTAKL